MGQVHACRPPCRDGLSNSVTGRNRCGAEDFGLVPDPDPCSAAKDVHGESAAADAVGPQFNEIRAASRKDNLNHERRLEAFDANYLGTSIKPITGAIPDPRLSLL